MFPHAPEGFGERLNIRRLRSDVNVNTANVNKIRLLETAAKGSQYF
jgi:hypothetical protein